MEDSSDHKKASESTSSSTSEDTEAKPNCGSQKPRLEVLPNDSSSSASSSPVNAELDEIIKNQDQYRKSFFEQYVPPSSTASSTLVEPSPLLTDNSGRRSSSRDSISSYGKRASSASAYGMRRSLLTGPILYENAMAEDLQIEVDEQSGRCHDCSRSTHLNKFGDVDLCDNCTKKRWQIEVNELVKVKSYLENTAEEMKKYLSDYHDKCKNYFFTSWKLV
jgi:hypothetical protein